MNTINMNGPAKAEGDETMSKALRLAKMIELYNAGVGSQKLVEDYLQASAELRRLDAIEQELEALKKAISEATPVAWSWEQQDSRSSAGVGGWGINLLFCHPPNDPYVLTRNVTPLYTLKGIKERDGLVGTH